MDALAKTQDVELWTAEQRDLIRRTCAVGATDDELSMYLHVAARSGLDPLRRQLHFMKVSGRVTFIADVNGLQARAAREPDFEGIDHAVVYEKDDFLFDQKTGEVVKHVNNPFIQSKPVGAWAIVHRKGKRPFVSCVRFSEYFNPNNPLWKDTAKPSVMIDKCAKSTALRLAYPEQFGGIYDRAEMDKVEEKEVNAAPETKALPAGTPSVKQQLKRAPAVVDVKPGESEAEATTRTKEEAKPAAPAPWEKLEIYCAENGYLPTAGWGVLKGLLENGTLQGTRKAKADLTEADLTAVIGELSRAKQAQQQVEKTLGQPLEPDMDAAPF